jgi:phosphomannomutase
LNTLIGLGIDVIDLGLSTTPTVEIAVPLEKAEIILTAFITKQWNALKLLNDKGEFLNGIEGEKYLLSLKPKRLISQMWIV